MNKVYNAINGLTCVHARLVRMFYSVGYRGTTIYSLSSGHGKCGVAVIRVSGPQAADAVQLMTSDGELPPPRQATLRTIHHPVSKIPLDRSLLLWFPGPGSFTGEDVCEYHAHGGPAVVSSILEALSVVPGLRQAQPGEYTKRAFQNGKMDLVEVEGLADLIEAETEYQRQQALRQMEGHLSDLYTTWRSRLLTCVANAEAYIDFSEDDNIEDDVLFHVDQDVEKLKREIEGHVSDNRRGERLRSGVQVTILGKPNVGKSSLLNAICQRPAAIVSPIAGTTRDVIETALNIGGYAVLLSDTAGLRHATDTVEVEGVSRAMARVDAADIKMLVMDVQSLIQSNDNLQSFITHHLAEVGFHLNCSNKQTEMAERTIDPSSLIVILNKTDLIENGLLLQKVKHFTEGISDAITVCHLSCKTQQGMKELLDVFTAKIKSMCGTPSQGNPSLTQARHRSHLQACLQALGQYQSMSKGDIVLSAECLRQALRHLGKITGQVTSEEILDVIFRDFCIGK